jgi:hypothetical protein
VVISFVDLLELLEQGKKKEEKKKISRDIPTVQGFLQFIITLLGTLSLHTREHTLVNQPSLNLLFYWLYLEHYGGEPTQPQCPTRSRILLLRMLLLLLSFPARDLTLQPHCPRPRPRLPLSTRR